MTSLMKDVLALARTLEPTWPDVTHRILASGHPTCLEGGEGQLRAKLKKVEEEIAAARAERVEAVAERDEAREKFASGESLSQDSDEFREAQAAVARVGELDDRIADLQGVQVATLKMLGKDVPGLERRAAGDPSDPRGEGGWDAGMLLAQEGIREALAHAATTKSRFGSVQLGEIATRDALVADVTGTDNMRRGNYLGVVPALRRRLRVLDLLPTATMDANVLPYTQETGSFDTAAETTEGTAKPEAAFVPVDASAEAHTIAHWLKIRKQALADYAALQGIMDSRLRYGVLRRLEAQVLAGDGAGDNILGVLNTAGIGSVAFTAGEIVADQILRGITTIFLADAEATGVVLHPTDWQNALIAKASGSGEYMAGDPYGAVPSVMWGVPLVPSRAVAQGTALVGDFEIGAQLFIREGVNVLLSDADGTDFTNNRVTILAEMRAALAVFRPVAFATVALQ